MALPNGIESTKELLDAQAHIWNHIFKFINSMSLNCAVQLGIPDIISNHGKPITLSDLTNALGVNKEKSHCIQRLMRLLVHSNIFAMEDEESYWLTPASRLLLRDQELSLTPIFHQLGPLCMDVWHHMNEWFKSDDAMPFVAVHGKTFWEMAADDPKLNQSFNESMASDSKVIAGVIVKDGRQVFEGLRSMVDVGGGTGTVAMAIADVFPDLKCVVFDLPHVVAGLEGTRNLIFVGGDMFEAIPPADAVFLKWILHDWSDKECITILKKCKQAIPSKDKGGKVIIVDIIMDGKNDDVEAMETKLFWDMRMMVGFSGKERTIEEWAKLFYEAGFTSYNITSLLGLRSLIEVFP